jgi:hypothetical protein
MTDEKLKRFRAREERKMRRRGRDKTPPDSFDLSLLKRWQILVRAGRLRIVVGAEADTWIVQAIPYGGGTKISLADLVAESIEPQRPRQ